MPIQFACPSCGKQVSAPDTALGAEGPCPFCGAQIVAPPVPGGEARLTAPPSSPPGEALAGPAPPAPGGPSGGVPGSGPVGMYPPPGPAYGPPPQAPVYGIGAPDYAGPPVLAPSGVLDTGAILSEAWQLVSTNAGLLIGGYLLVGLIELAVMLPVVFGGVMAQIMAPGGPGADADQPLATQGLLQFMSWLFMPLNLGPLYIADQLLTRGRSSIGALFLGYRQFFTILGATLLYGLAVTIGFFGLIVGGLFLATALGLVFMEIVDRRAGAIEALQASWEATAGRRLSVFGNLLVLWLVGLAGALLCGVGMLITWPISLAGYAILYREIRGLQGAAAA